MEIFTDLARTIRETRVPAGAAAVFWLGQASFVLKGSDGTAVAVDPFFSDVVFKAAGWIRQFPPPFPATALDVDVVVFTHDHIDHYDPEAVPGMAAAAPAMRFAGPASCMAHARRDGIAAARLVPLDRGATARVRGTTLSAVYAEHLTVGDPAADAIGVVIELGGVRVYHTGDTVYNAAVQEAGRALGRPDVLLVPINGNYAVMNSLDAALYTRDVQPRVVIPMHYGMFANNTADPYLFVRDLREQGAGARPVVMAVGGAWLYAGQ